MEVVHQGDSITHAVIGGKAAIEMTTDDSAHLMHMLSKALYKDQILAVCREVICNAWDAHIMGGCTDKPIDISFVDDILTITDYGPGIPYSKMGKIYGTYGGSTKTDSDDQTGGFGLGCKSPFAYTEHFDVISTCEGERTMYKITKSSAEVKGKPGIIPISSFPHEGSGLSVKIRINVADIREFKTKIERVVRNGEIKANFNGDLMTDLIEFSKAPMPWILTTNDPYPGEHGKIFVRYGNVIYPIDDHPEYSKLYSQAKDMVARFSSTRRSERLNIILMAPPSSLSIAPSRETLSMQEHTISNLKKLLEAFVANAAKSIEPTLKVINRKQVSDLVAVKNVRRLLARKASPLVQERWSSHMPEFVYDLSKLAEVYMANNYPEEGEFWRQDMKHRINRLMKAGLINRQLGSSFLKRAEIDGWGNRQKGTNWFTRYVAGPLKNKLRKAGLSTTTLYALDGDKGDWQYGDSYMRKPTWHSTNNLWGWTLRDQIPYLRNIVVLAYGKKNTEDRLNTVMERLGMAGGGEYPYSGVMVYIVNKKKENVEKAREAFKGYNIVDLTVRHKHEATEVSVEPKERKPRIKGYAALSAMFVHQNKVQEDGTTKKEKINQVDFRVFLDEEINRANRIEKPEFIFQQSMATGRYASHLNQMLGMSAERTLAFIKAFGHLGAVTNSLPQVQRAEKCDGVLPIGKWLVKQVQERYDSPVWREQYANSYRCAREHIYKAGKSYPEQTPVHEDVIQLSLGLKEIREEFGLTNMLSDDDKILLEVFWDLCEYELYSRQLCENLRMIFPSPMALHLEHKIQSSRLIGLLNVKDAKKIINSTRETDNTKKDVVEFILQAIKA